MASKHRKASSFRGLVLSSCCVLVLGVACGSNPELWRSDQPFDGSSGLGEPCESGDDCAAGLQCGDDGKCVGACGAVTGNSCGPEACLVSGLCSQGLASDCDKTSDCNEGLVCSDLGRCAVPCEPSATDACKDDATCKADGTCPTDRDVVLGLGGAGPGVDPPGGGGAGNCIDVDVDFEPQVPTVLLLIDRSGSMTDEKNFGDAVQEAVDAGTYELGDCPMNNDWRWNVVRDVLMHPAKGIVKPLEDRVRFGLSLYSSRNGRIVDGVPDPNKACPELIEVPIAFSNHEAMLDNFKCNDISDDTPTGESLLAAAATLNAFTEPGPKVIVLATDGEPDNCDCPDRGNSVPAACNAADVPQMIKDQVVATAEQIHADDITVHVINVSSPGEATLQQHLADVALAGGGQVYDGFSPGALGEAFEEIINGVRSCVIDLDGEIADGKESTGTVTLDGEALVLDDADGWRVNTPSQIELLGAACEAIKKGGHDLAIKFPCESFEPVVH
jgi:hypothetical protein